jgi:hypothetical protein
MPIDSKARVFVSHASEDKLFVRKLVEALREQNLNVWLDERELQVGDSIVAGVSQGLKNADYLVAVVSKASIGSSWVQAELNATLMEELSGKGVAVLPVLIEDCELPTLLKDRVYADFRDDFNTGLQKLLAVFEQEGESAANAAPEVATKAGCILHLSYKAKVEGSPATFGALELEEMLAGVRWPIQGLWAEMLRWRRRARPRYRLP